MERWRRTMLKISKLRTLSAQEWRYLLIALLLLPMLRVALRGWGFRRVFGMLVRTTPRFCVRSPSLSDAEIARLVRMVNVAGAYGPVRANCLPQSLVVWWLLRRHGVPSELRLGVSRRGGGFQAHAWVERDGVALNDRADVQKHFAAFDLKCIG